LPEIFFQIYMVIRIKQINEQHAADQSVNGDLAQSTSTVNVNPHEILISVLFASLHTFFEFIYIQLEKKAYDTDF
jgi:hypothetical protein